MAYSNFIRHQAVELRKKGYSLKEIAHRFGITKSTASAWSRDILLGKKAQRRLLTVIKRGQFINAKNRRAKTKATEQKYFDEALEEMRSNPDHDKIMCAMLYWCEGNKSSHSIVFTNSDPKLAKTFLRLFRKSFVIDESKFHPCIHIHSYHSEAKQLDFWSKITDINKRQFIKSYRKPNTGKRIRENYQGCLSLRYYNSDLARQLMAIAKAFLKHTGA